MMGTSRPANTMAPAVCPAEWGKVCVVSPHLDDAVLSCGALLPECASALIVTVLAGDSPDLEVLTEWDRLCGFENAALAMATRRDEDHLAAEILSCDVLHLPFPDGQYSLDVSTEDLAEGLTEALRRRHIDTLLLPLGIFHSDHMRVAAAWQHEAFGVLARNPAIRVIGYEDIPYRRMGDALQQALVQLAARGFQASPLHAEPPLADIDAVGEPIVELTMEPIAKLTAELKAELKPEPASLGTLDLKRKAMLAYASQLEALPPNWIEDAWMGERYWQLQYCGRA